MNSLTGSNTIKWFGPQVGSLEQQYIIDVLNSNYINDGEVTRKLERKIADYVGAKYCVAVTNCTSAIALALMSVGIKYGDEVIVPDLTFIATANAARLCGAVVKLVDVEPSKFTIDVTKAEEAINNKTKAIIAVDVNGRSSDYLSLEKLCEKYGIALICDSAEALGSRNNSGRFLGTFGSAGCFSFSANKTISSGQGGAIVTNSESLYHRMLELKDQGRRFGGSGGDDLHPTLGFNFKYTNLQAAVALAQFEKLDERLKNFTKRDNWYRKHLSNITGIVMPGIFSDVSKEVRQWTDIICDNRKVVEQCLIDNRIGFRNFWLPLHRQMPYMHDDKFFSNAIEISRKGLWLPSFFDLKEQDVIFISDKIRKALSI